VGLDGLLGTLLSSFHAMLDTEVVRFVRAEVEGLVHLVVSGLVCTSSFLSLLSEDFSEVDSSLEGHLSLLQGSQLSEEGGVREFGGFDGLLSSYFSLGRDLLDDGIGSLAIFAHALFGIRDSGFSSPHSGLISGNSFLGSRPSFLSSLENFVSHSDHLGGVNMVSMGSANDSFLRSEDFQVLEVFHGFLMASLDTVLVLFAAQQLLTEPGEMSSGALQTILESQNSIGFLGSALVVSGSLAKQVFLHTLDLTLEHVHLGVPRATVEIVIAFVLSGVLLVGRAARSSLVLPVCDFFSLLLQSCYFLLNRGLA